MNSMQQVATEPEHEIETDKAIVEAELNRLLGEKRFAGAPQLSRFLRYTVTETLEGRGDRIKAYTVGVDALGKPYTFDAQNDPSVRVLALRLRKTLVAMYESDQMRHAVVSFKVGNYTPEFYRAFNKVTQPSCTSTSPRSADLRDDQAGQFSASGTKIDQTGIGEEAGTPDKAAASDCKPVVSIGDRRPVLLNNTTRF